MVKVKRADSRRRAGMDAANPNEVLSALQRSGRTPRIVASRIVALKIVTPVIAFCTVLLGAAVGCGPRQAAPTASDALQTLFDEDWDFQMEENPLFATSVGDLRHNDRLGSVTAEAQARGNAHDQEVLRRLRLIDRTSFQVRDEANAEIFQLMVADRVADFEFGAWQIPLNADSGFHSGFSRLPNEVPLATVKHYEDYLSRLGEWPRYVDEQINNMRLGLERGFVLPKIVLQGYDSTYDAHIVEDAEKSVFWEPFATFPTTVEESEHERLREAGRRAIKESVVPGYAKFSQFMKTEYIPGCTESIAATDLPNGKEYYAQQVRYYTTLDITADQVHEIGRSEVKRIRAEMEQVLEEVQWDGTFAQFLDYLRTEPKFYAKTPDGLLKEASYIAKQIDGKLPRYFKTLPRMPYTVAPVPDSFAPKYTSGRYVGPNDGTFEPGYFWVNTYNLAVRPLYNLTALALHEAVPGHHLQGSLAREQESQPNFRRYQYLSAFGEGWGLYSEFLGEEMGMYKDAYSRFGRMTYEMWRACRLVVDTGMHAKGWTRQQAIDFLAENTALPLHEITTETDRYISWPGQALAYKMGELKIREVRKKAEAALGSKFDIREFHDAVLLGGSVPLPVLERQIDRFIESSLSKNTSSG